jgi:hypothetical protein
MNVGSGRVSRICSVRASKALMPAIGAAKSRPRFSRRAAAIASSSPSISPSNCAKLIEIVDGVGDALQAVDEVVRGQLARLAAERRVRREHQAGPHAQRIGAPVGEISGQRFGRVGDQLDRSRDVVVGQELVVQRRDRVERREAARARGVEHLDVLEHLQAQHLVRRGGGPGDGGCAGDRRDERGQAAREGAGESFSQSWRAEA